ncbi:TOTE conflict system archaeo-eukaryotic primase domain-containing protein [Amycolatopsis sp. EV170708-02-1]|uniref:TOTE conflict system archaeo-eukaryotic primase domain-containing protein n=1 Tax=Amycolatopsis sp. EV170708-02-1 TaxID=2919322 RepID=UPI001F0B7486|nr:hypothetical protein [Amycolatopsis sp. EV170708-02-1]UMP06765.1 hypothetical protein MJQ72_19005 [Amycolatopsis sp. EV170708-02-1]
MSSRRFRGAVAATFTKPVTATWNSTTVGAIYGRRSTVLVRRSMDASNSANLGIWHPSQSVLQTSSPRATTGSAALFAARTHIYATRWENVRVGKAGWLPSVRGGWRKGIRHEDRDYLPLSKDVLRAHLTGEVHVGLYPLLDGDLCWWLAADFDGPMAMLDALAYLKAARAWSVPAALEVSRSGVGAHAWVFFIAPVPAEAARRMDLASYDRLFPSQDVLPAGGVGNLIAAPLHGKARQDGAMVFLDLATMEPHDDQWAYLSLLGRMSPAEANRVARRAGRVTVGAGIDKIGAAVSTRIRATASPSVRARLNSGIRWNRAS